MECLEKDLEELKLPAEHRMQVRTTNLLKRLLGEGKRRTKVIPGFRSEKACLKLVYATLVVASKTWRGVRMTPKIEKELRALEANVFVKARVSKAA